MDQAFSIRRMMESDLPDVVELQRLSLGEGLIPRTEAFWRWKHLQNPFGESAVLLAFHDEKLVGLRAFMRWDWQKGEQRYQCLRAVDTATHPDYRGRGLFKTLTLQLLEEMKKEGFDFIFNTPNEKSMPGYLKMGWMKVGRVAVRIYPGKPGALWGNQGPIPRPPDAFSLQGVDWQEVEGLIHGMGNTNSGKLITPTSASFWKWRYQDVPEIDYFGGLFKDKGWVWLVGRIKTTKGRRELRLVELYGTDKALAKRCLQSLTNYYQPAFISLSGHRTGGILNKFGINFVLGPKLVLKPLHSQSNGFQKISIWGPSLGDFELF